MGGQKRVSLCRILELEIVDVILVQEAMVNKVRVDEFFGELIKGWEVCVLDA